MRVKYLATVLAVPLLALGAGVARADTAVHTGASRSQPVLGLQRVSHNEASSVNWAGYAVYDDTFDHVEGSWTQPDATCAKKNFQLAAFFVGIDGYGSSSVEQIGTEVDCVQGQPVHYAWYEMYPDPPHTIPCTIEPDDVITASVHYNSGSSFTIALSSDGGCNFSTTLNAPVTPERASAEWIAEAPATGGHFWPLTNFGTIGFSGASATNDSADTGDINDGPWSYDSITMAKWRGPFNSIVKAEPSDLTGGGSGFTVTWQSA